MNEAVVGAGILGGLFATIIIFGSIFYILLIIAWWKLFTKAGVAGWKSIIPIYNVYKFCQIIGMSFWIIYLVIPLVIGVVGAIINNQDVSNTLSSFYAGFVDVYTAILLGRAFNKGTGFKVGLVLLPNIFLLILGFNTDKYVGSYTESK